MTSRRLGWTMNCFNWRRASVAAFLALFAFENGGNGWLRLLQFDQTSTSPECAFELTLDPPVS